MHKVDIKCSPFLSSNKTICDMTESIYIPRGVNVYSLSRETEWYFEPKREFRVSVRIVLMIEAVSSPSPFFFIAVLLFYETYSRSFLPSFCVIDW